MVAAAFGTNGCHIEMSGLGWPQEVGVFNGGYWGVNIQPHGIYRVSMYLKAENDMVQRRCGLLT